MYGNGYLSLSLNNKLGKKVESEVQIKELYEQHPDFDKPYLEQILKGVNPQIQKLFMDNLQNLFVQK